MRRGLAGSIVLALGICGLVFAQAVRTGGGSSLPSQGGNSGKYLTTNGTAASWGTVTSGITALTSDVTASGSGSVAATVATVGTSTAANVHTAELTCNAATNANTASTIVKRDSSGNFVGTTFYGNVDSPAGANVEGIALGDGGMLCFNADCSVRTQVDGGVNSGLYSRSQSLDSSGKSAYEWHAYNSAGAACANGDGMQWYIGNSTKAASLGCNGTLRATTLSSDSQSIANQFVGSNTANLMGNVSDGVSAVAVAIGDQGGLSTTGSGVLVSWRHDTGASAEVGYTLSNGMGSIWTQHPVTGPGKKTGEYTIVLNSDTTFAATLLPAPTLYTAGTVASSPTADGTLNMIDYPTTASSGNAAGINGPYTTTRFDFRPRLTAVLRTGSSITNQVIYIGLSDGDISAARTLADFGSHRFVGAVYSSSGGADWTAPGQLQLLTSDGTTATASQSAISLAINTTYVVDLDVSRSGKAILRINNAANTTSGSGGYVLKTTNIPTGATDIGIAAVNVTVTTASKDLYLGKLALESN